METLRLNGIREDVKKIIEPYLKKILSIHKDTIASIVLYGSAAGKDFIPRRSDINLAIIFKKLEFSTLYTSLKVIQEGLRKKIPAPLCLSLEHINMSKDTFPIEFLEIQENHLTLYGEELFTHMVIGLSHLRLFCEREIKGKLIHIREAYLETGLHKKSVAHLMHKSLYGLMPIFRILIKMKNNSAPIDKKSIIVELCHAYNLNKDIFLAILEDKMGRAKIKHRDADNVFEQYIDEIEKLSKIIDKI